MDRRRFLQNLAATAAAANTLGPAVAGAQRAAAAAPARTSRTRGPVDVEGHTVVCKFTDRLGLGGTGAARVTWTVYEDLRTRDGAITFVGSNGESRVLTKSAEAASRTKASRPTSASASRTSACPGATCSRRSCSRTGTIRIPSR